VWSRPKGNFKNFAHSPLLFPFFFSSFLFFFPLFSPLTRHYTLSPFSFSFLTFSLFLPFSLSPFSFSFLTFSFFLPFFLSSPFHAQSDAKCERDLLENEKKKGKSKKKKKEREKKKRGKSGHRCL
jgi:predicted membrane protein